MKPAIILPFWSVGQEDVNLPTKYFVDFTYNK